MHSHLPSTRDSSSGTPTPLASDATLSADLTHSVSDLSTQSPPTSLSRIGQYEILELIGHGGMGIVFRARDNLGRIVALKQLIGGAASHPRHRQRFLVEARAIAGLDHPNIVPVYGFDFDGDQPFFTMKFVGGGTVSQHRDRLRGNARAVVELMLPVVYAIQHAHERRILHRDLKPSNIFLSEDGRPLVGDFGLAKALDDDSGELTQTGVFLGTPSYSSPEQRAGRMDVLSFPSDVYSLGIILFELVVGHRPGQTTAKSSPSVSLGSVERLVLEVHELDHSLRAVVFRCLRELPGDRYPTAAELAADLERWLKAEQVQAVLPPRSWLTGSRRRFLKWSRGAAVGLCGAAAGASYVMRSNAEAAIRRELAAGRAELLPDGRFRWHSVAAGEPTWKTMTDESAPYTRIQSRGLSLIDLVAHPNINRFQLTAEVRIVESNGGRGMIGVYAGRSAANSHVDEYPIQHLIMCVISEGVQIDPEQRRGEDVLAVLLAHGRALGTTMKIELDSAPPYSRSPREWRSVGMTFENPLLVKRIRTEGINPGFDRPTLSRMIGESIQTTSGLIQAKPSFESSDSVGILVWGCTADIRRLSIERFDEKQ